MNFISEVMEDFEDLAELRTAKAEEADAKTLSLQEAQARYGTK